MLAKGTQEYKRAGEVARILSSYATTTRNYAQGFELFFNKLGIILDKVMEAGGFAAEIAKTVEKSMNPYGANVARLSDKQAWVLACSVVENNIEL